MQSYEDILQEDTRKQDATLHTVRCRRIRLRDLKIWALNGASTKNIGINLERRNGVVVLQITKMDLIRICSPGDRQKNMILLHQPL